MKTNFTTEDIARSLYDVVPSEMHYLCNVLAELVMSVLNNTTPINQIQKEVIENTGLKTLLQILAGKDTSAGNVTLSFGSKNNIGDITINDLAGRDIIKPSLNFYFGTTIPYGHGEMFMQLANINNLGDSNSIDPMIVNFISPTLIPEPHPINPTKNLITRIKKKKIARSNRLASISSHMNPIIKIDLERIEKEIDGLLNYYDNSFSIPNLEHQTRYDLVRLKNLDEKASAITRFFTMTAKSQKSFPDLSDLRLVDLDFNEEDFLDVKVRNVGSQVVFIKAITLRVDGIWHFRPEPIEQARRVSQVLPSGHYNIKLDIKPTPYSTYFSIAQSVAPNTVDRFTFNIGYRNDDQFPTGFLITPCIVYNESNKMLECPQIALGSSCTNQYFECLLTDNLAESIVFSTPMQFEKFTEKSIKTLARNNILQIEMNTKKYNNTLRQIADVIYSWPSELSD